MRNFMISLGLIAIFLEISGLIWASKGEKPSEAYVQLTQPPALAMENPLANGYFLLLGLTASAKYDPIQTGYDIWAEATSDRAHRYFDTTKPGRSDLRLASKTAGALPGWQAENPLYEFHRASPEVSAFVDSYRVLIERYGQWLTMRFEDWGFGYRGTPPVEDILAIHRLYIAQGFMQGLGVGLDRLVKDLRAWRAVLADTRSIALKTTAVILIDDDVLFFSKLLGQPTVDQTVLTTAVAILRPLTAQEYSLRWPMQHEFVLGLTRTRRLELEPTRQQVAHEATLSWITQLAKLPPDAFQKIEHPPAETVLGLSTQSQRVWDTYAAYYEAAIKAADTVHTPLPRLKDVARSSQRTLLDTLAGHVDFEPDWEVFSQRLMETDARLRLAGLQVALRKPSNTKTVVGRLAEVGPQYFDPFTGLPMLWSETQGKVYSVGKDGLDDGGDVSFDITVPSVLGTHSTVNSPTPKAHAHSTSFTRHKI